MHTFLDPRLNDRHLFIFESWLDIEANCLFASLIPRASWILCEKRFKIIPSGGNISSLFERMSRNEQDQFFAINNVINGYHSFGQMTHLVLTIHQMQPDLMRFSPAVLTLSWILGVVEGFVEFSSISIIRNRPVSYDILLGGAANMRGCARALADKHVCHPLFSIISDVALAFAQITEHVSTACRSCIKQMQRLKLIFADGTSCSTRSVFIRVDQLVYKSTTATSCTDGGCTSGVHE